MSGLTDQELLDEVDRNGVDLTKWEITFVENLTVTLEEGEVLSLKQRKVLERIYEERVP